MWNLFKTKELQEQPIPELKQEEAEPLLSEEDEWSNIRVEGSRIVYGGELATTTVDQATMASSQGGNITDRVRADIMSRYPADEFHKNVIKITYFISKVGKLKSLEIDKNNEDFFDACEVIRRRLANPALEPALKFLSSDEVHDIFVLYYGVGPVVSDLITEVKAKKKARITRKMEQKGKAKTQETTEESTITLQSEGGAANAGS